jgi:hypothetical protein
MPKTYPVFRVTEWDTLRWLAVCFPHFVYRGQREVSWGLEPSLERACLPLRAGKSLAEVEAQIVREFQRGAEAYLAYIPELPERTNWLEWLALIQHHGGPTRLLDFTRSIYIAAFFAFDEIGAGDRAIWAVNPDAIRAALFQQLESGVSDGFSSEGFFDQWFLSALPDHAAIIVTPHRLNERINVQQGTFLCALSTAHTLEANLFGMLNLAPSKETELFRVMAISATDREQLEMFGRAPIAKLVLDSELAADALAEMSQMNIKHASLFPGLDGYARDLKRHAFWFSARAESAARYADTRTTPAP